MRRLRLHRHRSCPGTVTGAAKAQWREAADQAETAQAWGGFMSDSQVPFSCSRRAAPDRFDPFAKLSADDRNLRRADRAARAQATGPLRGCAQTWSAAERS